MDPCPCLGQLCCGVFLELTQLHRIPAHCSAIDIGCYNAKWRRGLCGPPTLRVTLCRGHVLCGGSERLELTTEWRQFAVNVQGQTENTFRLLLRTCDEHVQLHASVLTSIWHYRCDTNIFYIKLHSGHYQPRDKTGPESKNQSKICLC